MRALARALLLAAALAAALACTCVQPPGTLLRERLPAGLGICQTNFDWSAYEARATYIGLAEGATVHDYILAYVRMKNVSLCGPTTGKVYPGFCASSVAASVGRVLASPFAKFELENPTPAKEPDAPGCVVPLAPPGAHPSGISIASFPAGAAGGRAPRSGPLVLAATPSSRSSAYAWSARIDLSYAPVPLEALGARADGPRLEIDAARLAASTPYLFRVVVDGVESAEVAVAAPAAIDPSLYGVVPDTTSASVGGYRVRFSVSGPTDKEFRVWLRDGERSLLASGWRSKVEWVDWVPSAPGVWTPALEVRAPGDVGAGVLAAPPSPVRVTVGRAAGDAAAATREEADARLRAAAGAVDASASSVSAAALRLLDVATLASTRAVVEAADAIRAAARAAGADAPASDAVVDALARSLGAARAARANRTDVRRAVGALAREMALRATPGARPVGRNATGARLAALADAPGLLAGRVLAAGASSVAIPGSLAGAVAAAAGGSGPVAVTAIESDASPYAEDGSAVALLSPVLSVEVVDANGTAIPISGLSDGFTMTFAPPPPGATARRGLRGAAARAGVCAHYDVAAGAWSAAGCATAVDASGAYACTCSHLTDFAVVDAGGAGAAPTPTPAPAAGEASCSCSAVGPGAPWWREMTVEERGVCAPALPSIAMLNSYDADLDPVGAYTCRRVYLALSLASSGGGPCDPSTGRLAPFCPTDARAAILEDGPRCAAAIARSATIRNATEAAATMNTIAQQYAAIPVPPDGPGCTRLSPPRATGPGASATPTPTPTPSPSATPTPSPSATPLATPTPSPAPSGPSCSCSPVQRPWWHEIATEARGICRSEAADKLDDLDALDLALGPAAAYTCRRVVLAIGLGPGGGGPCLPESGLITPYCESDARRAAVDDGPRCASAIADSGLDGADATAAGILLVAAQYASAPAQPDAPGCVRLAPPRAIPSAGASAPSSTMVGIGVGLAVVFAIAVVSGGLYYRWRMVHVSLAYGAPGVLPVAYAPIVPQARVLLPLPGLRAAATGSIRMPGLLRNVSLRGMPSIRLGRR